MAMAILRPQPFRVVYTGVALVLVMLGHTVNSADRTGSVSNEWPMRGQPGSSEPQLCICSPKMQEHDTQAPDCKCTDFSVLDALFLGDMLVRDSATTTLPRAKSPKMEAALDKTANTAPSLQTRNASRTEGNDLLMENVHNVKPSRAEGSADVIAARALHYKSARAVLFERTSRTEESTTHVRSSHNHASTPSQAASGSDSLNSPGMGRAHALDCEASTNETRLTALAASTSSQKLHVSEKSTSLARKEPQAEQRKDYDWKDHVRMLSMAYIDYLRDAPGFILGFKISLLMCSGWLLATLGVGKLARAALNSVAGLPWGNRNCSGECMCFHHLLASPGLRLTSVHLRAWAQAGIHSFQRSKFMFHNISARLCIVCLPIQLHN
jgi:hypothetical protein